MNKQFMKHLAKDIFIDIIGGVLIAIGIFNFAVNAHFPMTGISGIALIFYYLFQVPIGTMTMILNIPIALVCYRILGRTFFIRSLKSIVITSVIMDTIGPLLPMYDGDRLLAAICTGVFAGLGYAIIYMNNSSTGGVDFITMSIRVKKPHISLGKIVFAVDVAVVLFGGFILKEVDGVIYGILLSYIMSTVVDKLMYGIDAGKMTLIVTTKGEEMSVKIEALTGRGSTLLHGKGSYSKEDKDILMCASNNKQMFQIKKIAKSVDPHAFTVIMESNEVLGEGFKLEI